MSSDGLEKCKSVKKDAIEEDFPAYGLIWQRKAYAFGSEKEVISLSMLSLITFWFANIHELWKLCLSGFDYWEEP